MLVYRIHIRPKGGLGDPKFAFNYCLKKQVLGLGWQRIKSKICTKSWGEYEKEAIKKHGAKELSRVRYLKDNIKKDDLIWTRDTKDNYYLARVLSEWEYYTNNEAQDADITNIVRCNILKVPSVDDVMGKIVACFRPTRAIQAIRDETALEYSRYLWNKLSKSDYYQISTGKFGSIFSFIDSEEAEDIIFIYLQLQGWVVVPNSRKADTMSYEFYLINRSTKEKAIVQVKTGNTPLDPAQWGGRSERVFLFQANDAYKCNVKDGVTCLDPKEIEKFIYSNQDLMPANVLNRIKMLTKRN